MNGSCAIRGYLVQGLIAVLEALRDDTWASVCIEPCNANEQIDIRWRRNGEVTADQVKSSQNQITLPVAQRWAEELRVSAQADKWRLWVVGPCSDRLIKAREHRGVTIMSPKTLDVSGMVWQLAHLLDDYLQRKMSLTLPAFVKELLVEALLLKFMTYSTGGEEMSREDFESLLIHWVTGLYPRAANQALAMQCDILWNTIVFPHPTLIDDPVVLLPIAFVNAGVRTSIIEWIALFVEGDECKHLYQPLTVHDLTKIIQSEKKLLAPENTLAPFSEFAVMPSTMCRKDILFKQVSRHPVYPHRKWKAGWHTFRVVLKYRDCKLPFVVPKELRMEVSDETLKCRCAPLIWQPETLLDLAKFESPKEELSQFAKPISELSSIE